MNWPQLRAILWLRWSLTRNQWSRRGGIGAVVAVIVAVVALFGAGAAFVAGFLGGLLGLRDAHPRIVMIVWLILTGVFLVGWTLGLLTELQRSETIDLQRLMHLPVALGQIFFINYLVSHLTLTILLAVPAMIGLALGLAVGRGSAMLLLLPLALGMVTMITAWTYCLRGWISAMMANPRRRRAIIVGISALVMLISQAPNLYFNVIQRNTQPAIPASTPAEASRQIQARHDAEQGAMRTFIEAEAFIPPLWLPASAGALAEHRPLPALLATLGCFAIGGLGLRRAYRTTVRFYHGQARGAAAPTAKPAVSPPAATTASRSRFLEYRIPGVPEQAAALALATFRSLMRAPEVKMAWGSSFLITILLAASFMSRSSAHLPDVAKPFVATGCAAFSVFMLMNFFNNVFGYDRDGFRVLVLCPADRRYILLGKNLAAIPVRLSFALLVIVGIAVWLRLPVTIFLATVLQLVMLLVITNSFGNIFSILAPYRIQQGSMKPTKMTGTAMVGMMLSQMILLPLAMAPAFLPPCAQWLWNWAGLPAVIPVNLLVSLIGAVAAVVIYWRTLGLLGRFLQSRETKILISVTSPVE